MKHKLNICVSKEPKPGGVVMYKRVNLRERILRYLLGELRQVTVIVPGDSVECLSITEVPHD